jgi:hypothetical protein
MSPWLPSWRSSLKLPESDLPQSTWCLVPPVHSLRNLLPAVKVSESAVILAPDSKSPFAVVVTLPLFGLALLP